MKIQSVSGKGSFDFTIEQNVQKLRITNIKGSSLIRIDEDSKSSRSRNVFPEMTVKEMVDLMIAINPTAPTVEYDETTDTFTEIVIVFAVGGVLKLNSNKWYAVELSKLANKAVDFYVSDAFGLGSPLTIDKHTVDTDETELELQARNNELIVFTTKTVCDKLSYYVDDRTRAQVAAKARPILRKVEFSNAQLLLANAVAKYTHAITDANGVSSFSGLIGGLSIGVQPLSNIVIHDINTSIEYYYSIDYKKNN